MTLLFILLILFFAILSLAPVLVESVGDDSLVCPPR
jgi:hypothetical protein